MFNSIALPSYDSLKKFEGKGEWAIGKYYQWPYSFFYQHKLKMIISHMGDRFYRNILDFGSGPGIFSRELHRHAHFVTEYDLGTAIDPRWNFDIIVCASSLEFVHLNHTLKMLKSMLKRGGFLIVASPMDSLLSRLYFKKTGVARSCHSHLEIIEAVKKHFTIVEQKSWMSLYFSLKAVSKD